MPRERKTEIERDDTVRRLDVELKRVQLQFAKEQLDDLRQSRWKKPVAAVLMACLGLLLSISSAIILPSISRATAPKIEARTAL
jgi:hypothetical protein